MNELLKELKLLDVIKYVISAIVFFYSLFSPLEKKVELHSIQIEANTQAIKEIQEINNKNNERITSVDKTLAELASYLKGKKIIK